MTSADRPHRGFSPTATSWPGEVDVADSGPQIPPGLRCIEIAGESVLISDTEDATILDQATSRTVPISADGCLAIDVETMPQACTAGCR